MKTSVKIGSAKASLGAQVLLKLMGIWKPESISWEKKKNAALRIKKTLSCS